MTTSENPNFCFSFSAFRSLAFRIFRTQEYSRFSRYGIDFLCTDGYRENLPAECTYRRSKRVEKWGHLSAVSEIRKLVRLRFAPRLEMNTCNVTTRSMPNFAGHYKQKVSRRRGDGISIFVLPLPLALGKFVSYSFPPKKMLHGCICKAIDHF